MRWLARWPRPDPANEAGGASSGGASGDFGWQKHADLKLENELQIGRLNWIR
jgi:hypothetical protein